MSKKHRDNINGWLVINKPVGVNSTKVVSIIKRVFNAQKVGHAGTLDPLACGVLPIALGEATKTINYTMDADKEYVFTVKWGEATSTDDMEGEVIATSDKIPAEDEIMAVLPEFIGDIQQIPPAYSAIKIDGKRAYDIARSGVEVEMKSRIVQIFELELLGRSPLSPTGERTSCWTGVIPPSTCSLNIEMNVESGVQPPTRMTSATFRVKCGKGTYVRSLARDIAEKLGTKGHVTELIRTRVGKFFINNAILLENFDNKVYKAAFSELLMPVEQVLDDIPVLSFNSEESRVFRQGQRVCFVTNGLKNGDIAVIKSDGKLIALGEVEEGYIKPSRVFNI